jgi:hypothetical protein
VRYTPLTTKTNSTIAPERKTISGTVLNPLIEAGLIEMTIPDKPQSSKQKYRLSNKGLAFLSGGQRPERATIVDDVKDLLKTCYILL